MSFAQLPKDINLHILNLLDPKSKARLRASCKFWQNLFASQPKNIEDMNFFREQYVQDYSQFYTKTAVELAAKVFDVPSNQLEKSEIFETNILQHALALDRNMCPSIPDDISVNQKAKFYCDPYRKNNERIFFRYLELSHQQVNELAAVYNKYYPDIRAEVYNPHPTSSTKDIDFVLVFLSEPFCKQAMPVIRDIILDKNKHVAKKMKVV